MRSRRCSAGRIFAGSRRRKMVLWYLGRLAHPHKPVRSRQHSPAPIQVRCRRLRTSMCWQIRRLGPSSPVLSEGGGGGNNMTRDQMLAHLRAADAVAREAAAHGHHPFGAVLVGPGRSRADAPGKSRHGASRRDRARPTRRRRMRRREFPVAVYAGFRPASALRDVHRHALLGE